MTLDLLVAVLALLCLSALASALTARWDRLSVGVGTAGGVLACAVGEAVALRALGRGQTGALRWSWSLPLGQFHVGLDPLSSFFLVCVFLVSGLAAIYGVGYLRGYLGRRRLAPAAVFFNLLIAAMAVLVLARDGVLFLLAWEVMSLAGYFLVTFEHPREEVRRAGMTYLIASQLGVVFVFVLFVTFGRASGSYDFDSFAVPRSPALAGLCFLLALVGFGTKAGLWPVHIWLPDAYPAAPSHVSAVMSGVMSKMGVYGLLRVLGFLGAPPAWWGGALLAVGAISGIAGILLSNAQRDLKRRLAYSSVENVGIITLGVGLGVLAQSQHHPALASVAYAGALLHVLNHGLFKGLLFMAAGSVQHGTGTRDLDELGGLGRRMPWTAATFLLGSCGICGLPPLNGFVSEWLVYWASFKGAAVLGGPWAVCALGVIPALALIGGLAAASFVQAYGGAFLGQPRSAAVERAREATGSMRVPMQVAGAGCVAVGLWPLGALRLVAPAVAALSGWGQVPAEPAGSLAAISRVAAVLLLCVGGLGLLRRWLLAGRPVRQAATWGCGYVAPTPRMQYTAASFAQPLLEPFSSVIAGRVEQEGPAGFFPTAARYEERLGDMAGERMLVPATRRVVNAFSRLHVLQQGRLQLYLVYIAATLVLLLGWQLLGGGR